ncbi:hypothetical protein [Desulfocurvus sp. DL9XJH121]
MLVVPLLLCALSAAAPQALARVVEVPLAAPTETPAAAPLTRDQARDEGFRRAVFAEALDILPGTLAPRRAELLRDHLAPKAGEYVLSYSEALIAAPEAVAPETAAQEAPAAPAMGEGAAAGTPAMDPGAASARPEAPAPGILRLDVAVNRAALKKALKLAGVYYTLSASQPCDLSLTGQASWAWDEMGRLQAFTGVSVVRGAEPLLEIDSSVTETTPEERKAGLDESAPMWSASLTGAGNRWTAAGRDLEAVWLRVWSGWFSRPGAEAGLVDVLTLSVSGWYASDGVKAFAETLGSWENLVEGAELREVRMLPDGLTGIFSVRTLDRAALEARLGEELPPRGLSWRFVETKN